MTSKILNIVLAIALAILAIELTMAKKAAPESQNADEAMLTLDAIAQRSSIRAYSDRPV